LLLMAKSQQNYTVMEKEMLSIVATSEEFWDMLLGVDLLVFNNHKNLTVDTLKMQLVLHWCNKVENFSPTLHYMRPPTTFWLITCLRSIALLHRSDLRGEESHRPSRWFLTIKMSCTLRTRVIRSQWWQDKALPQPSRNSSPQP
jgi:hypothetical protein